MGWADKQLRAYRKQKEDEARAARVKELALAELMKDENYSRVLREQYSHGFDQAVEQVKDQIRVAFMCSVAVALEYEHIGQQKIRNVLAMVDEFTNQDKTSDEFLKWCERETGIRFKVREETCIIDVV